MSEIDNFEMYDIVVVEAVLKRVRDWRANNLSWQRSDLPKNGVGVIIGKRTLTDGTMEEDTGEEAWEGYLHYEASSTRRVLLVVFNERENPVYVDPLDAKATMRFPAVAELQRKRAGYEERLTRPWSGGHLQPCT